jgi:cytosine/adenosine deaminase-related metal-dependent hydrolase
MIEEVRYAAFWSDAQFPPVFTAKELVLMATSNAAAIARIDDKVGKLAKGRMADYVIVRRGQGSDPYQSLIYAAHEDVLAVAVGGRPLYGDATLMKTIHPAARVETITVCGASKGVDMSDSDNGKGISFAETVKNVEAAFRAFSLSMAGLAECP